MVLVVLLAGTVTSGFWLRDRLAGAAAILDPMVAPELADSIAESDDLGVPTCGAAASIVEEVRQFHAVVAAEQAEAESEGAAGPELTSTRARFDSFMLESATARVTAAEHSLVVTARPVGSVWCIDDAEFVTEQGDEILRTVIDELKKAAAAD